MPWCEPCGAFYNPNSLPPDGTCPRCGAPVSEGDFGIEHDHDEDDDPEADGADHGIVRDVPWHFWVGVAAVVLYLGWRLIQGVLLLF
jgi:hypothetical protein